MTVPAGSFKIGTIQCTPVSDGSCPFPPSVFFADVPEKELQARGLRTDAIESTFTCHLVTTARNKVLIDTGAGRLAPSTGKLLENLTKAGVAAKEIDTVILTHAHPDHIGGAIDAEGKAVFPNARYLVGKDEYDFWTSENPDLSAMRVPDEIKIGLILATARRSLPPLRKQIELVSKELEVVPGIHMVRAAGHTPGHMAVAISSGNDTVMHIGDAVIHLLQLEPSAWKPGVDVAPDQAAETRRRLLDRVAVDRLKVMAFHFPFPAVGRITSQKTGGWKWEAA